MNTHPANPSGLITLYRRKPYLVAALQRATDWLLVGRNGEGQQAVSPERFAAEFEPATAADLEALTVPASNGTAQAIRSPRGKARRTPGRSATPAPAVAKRGGRSKRTDAQLAWAKAEWQSGAQSVRAIAKKVGVSDPTVHGWAKRHNWGKRPKRAATVRGPKSAGATTPQRRCSSCEQITTRDPCHLCGKSWNRAHDA